jgi:hypothetical protein
MYTLIWKNPSIDLSKVNPILVPVASVVAPGIGSNNSALTLTGKGAANYGFHQQTNLLRLLENFADNVPPTPATIGMTWYDSAAAVLKVCVAVTPIVIWQPTSGITTSATPPLNPDLGSVWFQPTGTSSGIMYVYSGVGRYGSATPLTTIGGWEQVWPQIEVIAGRDEYDAMRELLEQIAGEAGTYGSGAIRRLITNLTNFTELDRSLRLAHTALGLDTNNFFPSIGDPAITTQAINPGTLFVLLDTSSANDSAVVGFDGNGNALQTEDGSIYVNNVATVVAPLVISTNIYSEDSYILWDRPGTIPGSTTLFVARFVDGVWQYENTTTNAWAVFSPVANQLVIGTISFYQGDNNLVLPGAKKAVVWGHAVDITNPGNTHLKVEPNSQDWDTLQAAFRYAVNRLDLPESYVTSLGQLPFVRDGRQAPSSLTSLPATDVRFPSAARRANRWAGIARQVSAFGETNNIAAVAINNRFSLKGISGASGTNGVLSPSVTITPHQTFTQVFASGGGVLRLRFNFATFDERNRFLFSGSAVQLGITQAAGGAGFTNFSNLLATCSTMRFTADKTRVFSNGSPLTLSTNIINVGLWNAPSNTDAPITLTTQTFDPAAFITVKAYRYGNNVGGNEGYPTSFDIEVIFSAGAALSGATTFTFSIIQDTATF